MTASGLTVAFLAGIVSVATPCVLPLVPGYLAAIGGMEASSGGGAPTLRAAAPFIAGFTAVFVLLGLVAGGVGQALQSWLPEIERGAGIVVVAVGFALMGLLPVPEISRFTAPGLERARRRGSGALLGAAFACCWSPCLGSVLGPVLVLASSTGTAPRAAGYLLVYSAGLALAFVLVGLAYGRVLGAFRILRDHYREIRTASGALLVVLGLLVFFDRLWWVNAYVNHVLTAVGADRLPGA